MSHPIAIYEPVNLASTPLPILYTSMLLRSDNLSEMQKDTICRILQAFNEGKSFLLGDAPGIGKGRTIAGLMHEIKIRHPDFRAVWLSANMRLKSSALEEMAHISHANLEKNIIFASYYSLLNPDKLFHIENFLQEGMSYVVLDECHFLRRDSVTSQIASRLKQFGSVLYSSATAASCSKHLHYLDNLGLWGEGTPFCDFNHLHKTILLHGLPMMELLATQMKSHGVYLSRQLNCKHTFHFKKVHLGESQRRLYDVCAQRIPRHVISPIVQQSFFQRLITGFKTPYAIQLAQRELNKGRSVIISVSNTCEATARRLGIRHRNKKFRVCEDILSGVHIPEELVDYIPINPIDAIIDAFGSQNVIEVTGRNRIYTDRDTVNMFDEIQAFQSGRKRVCVISRAGGVGISLNTEFTNKCSHIILEVPWACEDFVQQIGRSYRTNSQFVPEYYILSSDVRAEQRFMHSLVSKLSKMGAIMRGDQTDGNVSSLSETKWNTHAKHLLTTMCAYFHLRESEDFEGMTYTDNEYTFALEDVCSMMTQGRTKQIRFNGKSHFECHYPFAFCVFERWTTERHHLYPQHFKEMVKTLLLCHGSLSAHDTFRLLPSDMIEKIIEKQALYISNEDMLYVTRHLLQMFNINISFPNKITNEHLLNRLLQMPLRVQDIALEYLNFMTSPQSRQQISCFNRFISSKAGYLLMAKIVDVVSVTLDDSEGSGVEVLVGFDAISAPNVQGIYKYNIMLKKTGVVRDSEIIYADGTRTSFTPSSRFSDSNDKAWNKELERVRRRQMRRMERMPRKYTFAVKNAMHYWNSSMQKVLRIKRGENDHIVGLLLRAT